MKLFSMVFLSSVVSFASFAGATPTCMWSVTGTNSEGQTTYACCCPTTTKTCADYGKTGVSSGESCTQ
ncbi:hypothetical protein [Legionella sp. km772]|uniref:hypothetical protein n=1 Tax=Legionella sp. km772 TaxID=2498111 RepID=UPI000F8F0957|nr:hypothetical protein [Legionella sp. km772]RUR04434.1 hypothetical protein ELY15_15510 [Legionella sp. km772]